MTVDVAVTDTMAESMSHTCLSFAGAAAEGAVDWKELKYLYKTATTGHFHSADFELSDRAIQRALLSFNQLDRRLAANIAW